MKNGKKKSNSSSGLVVAKHSTRPTSVRIQEPLADQITIGNVPIARPICQFRGEVVEIFDLEGGDKKREREDPNMEALFDEGFFKHPTK